MNKKSQSAKAKDFAVSAQMRREARTRETFLERWSRCKCHDVMFASHKREHFLQM